MGVSQVTVLSSETLKPPSENHKFEEDWAACENMSSTIVTTLGAIAPEMPTDPFKRSRRSRWTGPG